MFQVLGSGAACRARRSAFNAVDWKELEEGGDDTGSPGIQVHVAG